MIIRLRPYQREMLIEHFSSKYTSPKHLQDRFGRPMTEQEISQYVSGLDFEKDYLIADLDVSLPEPRIEAFGHLVMLPDGNAEFGVSWTQGGFEAAARVSNVAYELLTEFKPRNLKEIKLHVYKGLAKTIMPILDGSRKGTFQSAVGVPRVRHAGRFPVDMSVIWI